MMDAVARMPDRMIRDFREYVDQFVTDVDRVPQLLAAHEPVVLTLTFTMNIDAELVAMVNDEIERLKSVPRDNLEA